MSTINNNEDTDIEINEDQVALYLKNHPGFFLKRDDLLCELELAHPSGSAVSLLERQVSLLRERNMDVRSRLGDLLDNARNNDLLFEKTQKLVLSMLEAKSLDNLVSCFTRSLTSDFNMDYARLTLFGRPDAYANTPIKIVTIDEAYEKIPGLLRSNNPTCGVLRDEELQFLFGSNSEKIGSAAVAPLTHGQDLGVIAIGSLDSQYFRASTGTLFLDYLSEVLNRILPNFMQQNEHV